MPSGPKKEAPRCHSESCTLPIEMACLFLENVSFTLRRGSPVTRKFLAADRTRSRGCWPCMNTLLESHKLSGKIT